MALAGCGAEADIWRLARSPAVAMSVRELLDLPASVLWQSEIMADEHDRIARRQALQDDHDRQVAAMTRRRR